MTVTRNGRDALVVMTSSEYEAQQLQVARGKLLARMAVAEDEYRSGRFTDGDRFISALMEEHGL